MLHCHQLLLFLPYFLHFITENIPRFYTAIFFTNYSCRFIFTFFKSGKRGERAANRVREHSDLKRIFVIELKLHFDKTGWFPRKSFISSKRKFENGTPIRLLSDPFRIILLISWNFLWHLFLDNKITQEFILENQWIPLIIK